ncbi:hypothetical protein BOX15_Mlig023679g1, partial [Macrostomum lignano]
NLQPCSHPAMNDFASDNLEGSRNYQSFQADGLPRPYPPICQTQPQFGQPNSDRVESGFQPHNLAWIPNAPSGGFSQNPASFGSAAAGASANSRGRGRGAGRGASRGATRGASRSATRGGFQRENSNKPPQQQQQFQQRQQQFQQPELQFQQPQQQFQQPELQFQQPQLQFQQPQLQFQQPQKQFQQPQLQFQQPQLQFQQPRLQFQQPQQPQQQFQPQKQKKQFQHSKQRQFPQPQHQNLRPQNSQNSFGSSRPWQVQRGGSNGASKRPWPSSSGSKASKIARVNPAKAASPAVSRRDFVLPDDAPHNFKQLVENQWCSLCLAGVNSIVTAEVHYNGKTHQRQLRENGLPAGEYYSGVLNTGNSQTPELPEGLDTQYCKLCDVTFTNTVQMFQHYSGRKHRSNAQDRTLVEKKQSAETKIFRCDVCGIFTNTQDSLDCHLGGMKHKAMLEARNQPKKDEGVGQLADEKGSAAQKPAEMSTHMESSEHKDQLSANKAAMVASDSPASGSASVSSGKKF